jgi:histone deacetylase 11
MRIIHSDEFAIAFPRANMLHPADTRKSANAWSLIAKTLPQERLRRLLLPVERAVGEEELRLVHSAEYLEQLRTSANVAEIAEVPLIAVAPYALLEKFLLAPMRLAVQGTLLACIAGLQTGLAASTSGGFHRARPDGGAGFSIYADVAVALTLLRSSGALGPQDWVAHIDLDAHLGSGLAHCFMMDPRVRLYDLFNDQAYPRDRAARDRLDTAVPVTPHAGGEAYLAQLRATLPGFLDARTHRLAIYTASTNALAADWVGGLQLTETELLERDRYVIREAVSRGIPLVVLAGGGYTAIAHKLLATTLIWMAEVYGK